MERRKDREKTEKAGLDTTCILDKSRRKAERERKVNIKGEETLFSESPFYETAATKQQ